MNISKITFVLCSVTFCTLLARTSFAKTDYNQAADTWTLDELPAGTTLEFTQTYFLPPGGAGATVNKKCGVFANTGSASYRISQGQTFVIDGVAVREDNGDYQIVLKAPLNLTVDCGFVSPESCGGMVGCYGGSTTVAQLNSLGGVYINPAPYQNFPNR